MFHESKIAAAILTSALAPRATEGQSVAEAEATLARIYQDFLGIVEKSPSMARRSNEEWRLWAQQFIGVLPH
jgi:hypothetical protein